MDSRATKENSDVTDNAPEIESEIAQVAPAEITDLPPSLKSKRYNVHVIAGTAGKQPFRLPARSSEDKSEEGNKESRKRKKKSKLGDFKSWDENIPKKSLLWICFSGTGLIATLVLVLIISNELNAKKRPGEASIYKNMIPEESEDASEALNREFRDLLLDAEADGRRIYTSYLFSKSVDDFIANIRHGKENRDLIMRNWKPTQIPNDWKFDGEEKWKVSDNPDFRHALLQGRMPDFKNYAAIFVFENNTLKMDWKATVAYCSADFKELQERRGDASEIRAYVSTSNFYTNVFPDSDFRCYKIVSPDKETSLWGYTKIDDEVDNGIKNYFFNGNIIEQSESEMEIQMLLELKPGPEDSMPNQWVIKKFIGRSWLDRR